MYSQGHVWFAPKRCILQDAGRTLIRIPNAKQGNTDQEAHMTFSDRHIGTARRRRRRNLCFRVTIASSMNGTSRGEGSRQSQHRARAQGAGMELSKGTQHGQTPAKPLHVCDSRIDQDLRPDDNPERYGGTRTKCITACGKHPSDPTGRLGVLRIASSLSVPGDDCRPSIAYDVTSERSVRRPPRVPRGREMLMHD